MSRLCHRIWLPGALALLGLIGPLGPTSTHASAVYAIDPRTGRIEFSVSYLGLFHSHGGFPVSTAS